MANTLATGYAAMSSPTVPIRLPHIAVCICTYKRPQLLKSLLQELAKQDTSGRLTYSIVVADNDASRSAEDTVNDFTKRSTVPVHYCVEPEQSIALARNKAVANATGDFIAFIDDDEFPISRWLLTLLQTCEQYQVQGVLGPVLPHFPKGTPTWVVRGKFYNRPTYPTGYVIDWRKGRTGNVLLKRELFRGQAQPFNPKFRTGEDQEFFSRMIDLGNRFIWCNEAWAYEVVPPIRCKRTFLLRRSLLRGSMEPHTPGFGLRDVLRSVAALAIYTIALPIAVAFGQHRFMNLSVRLSYHVGKLLALAGVDPIRVPYVTE